MMGLLSLALQKAIITLTQGWPEPYIYGVFGRIKHQKYGVYIRCLWQDQTPKIRCLHTVLANPTLVIVMMEQATVNPHLFELSTLPYLAGASL